MVKSGVKIAKLGNSKIVLSGKIGTRLAKKLGEKNTADLKKKILSGKPLSEKQTKLLLSVANKKLTAKLNSVKQIKVGNPFGKKSSKYINIEKVAMKKGATEVKDVVASLASKLGVNSNKLEKLTVRVAENKAEEKAAGFRQGVEGNFDLRNNVITVSKGLLKDITKGNGEKANAVLIHELGHYLVAGKKKQTEGYAQWSHDITSSSNYQRRFGDLSPELKAEEIGVELLAQSLSDSRDKLGYEGLISRGVSEVSKKLNMSLKDATEAIINVGLNQPMSSKLKQNVLGVLRNTNMNQSTGVKGVVQMMDTRDKVLDAALDVFEKKGFDVVRTKNATKSKNYRTANSIHTKQDKQINKIWQWLQYQNPDMASSVAVTGGLVLGNNISDNVEAKELFINIDSGKVSPREIQSRKLPEATKQSLLKAKAYVEGVRLRNIYDKAGLLKNLTSKFGNFLSSEDIGKISSYVSSSKGADQFTTAALMLNSPVGLYTLTQPAGVNAFALRLGGVKPASMGSEKAKRIIADAETISKAAKGDVKALASVKSKYPDIAKRIGSLKSDFALMDSLSSQQRKDFELALADASRKFTFASLAHPKKYSQKKLQRFFAPIVAKLNLSAMQSSQAIEIFRKTLSENIKMLKGNEASNFSNATALLQNNIAKATQTKAVPPKPVKSATPKVAKSNSKFSFNQSHKDFLTNAAIQQDMGKDLSKLKTSKPEIYKELEKNGYISNAKLTSKGREALSQSAVKATAKSNFSLTSAHKDMITNAIMKQQMGKDLSSLKASNPKIYNELENNGYIANSKLTEKGRNVINK